MRSLNYVLAYRVAACTGFAILASCGGSMTRTTLPNVPILNPTLNDEQIDPNTVRYQQVFRFHGSDGSSPTGLAWSNGLMFGLTYSGAKYGGGVAFTLKLPHTLTVHRFGGGTDARRPQGAPTVLGKSVYGATGYGGAGDFGTVFALGITGTEQWRYSFKGPPDGESPYAGLTNVNGTLFGTTHDGGVGCSSSGPGCGTVFSMSLTGKETILRDFSGNGKDGAHPFAPPIALNGTLFGTTGYGGVYGEGTVYSLTMSGKEKVLHSFSGSPEGKYPEASLTAVNNELYGTTVDGGKYYAGTAFRISSTGKEEVLYNFGKFIGDGRNPNGPLLFVNGAFYGVTLNGGTKSGGVVFKLTLSGKEHVLYSFQGGPDGFSPIGGLVHAKGVLYGVTTSGGGRESYGTIFSLTP